MIKKLAALGIRRRHCLSRPVAPRSRRPPSPTTTAAPAAEMAKEADGFHKKMAKKPMAHKSMHKKMHKKMDKKMEQEDETRLPPDAPEELSCLSGDLIDLLSNPPPPGEAPSLAERRRIEI